MHETALVSACAWCTRWILSCGLLLAKVRAERSHSSQSDSHVPFIVSSFFSPTSLSYPLHPVPFPFLYPSPPSRQRLAFILFHRESLPFQLFSKKPLLPLLQSSCSLAPAPFAPFHPFWNHTSTLPPKRISTSLPLLLMRIHNLSPVAWTPIPQCGCLIGFGCGCTSGTRLQVVSS